MPLFFECKLTELVIPEGVETIGDKAFTLCESLLSVTLPSSIKKIGSGAFYLCYELADVVIPDSVTSIAFSGDPVFGSCGKLKLAARQRLKDLGYKGEF